MIRELKGYKKYQLEWMIEHGHSLEDLIYELTDQDGCPDIKKIFDEWEAEIGFKGSEIWACEDEWEDNENAKYDDKTLFEYVQEMLKEKPYKNWNAHKDYKCLFSSEHEIIGDDSTLYEFYFFVERNWLEQYVAENYNVSHLQEWLDEIYTSDESDQILEDGIKAGVVAGVYK